MTTELTIPNIQLESDDDLAGSLDRQIIDQSPPLDRLESQSPTLTYTSYFGNDTTNNLDSTSKYNIGTNNNQPISTIKPSTLSNNMVLKTSNSSGSSGSSLATQRSYLFALLTCPDMEAYLTNHELSEDAYRLPLPLSTMLIEAKEEVIAYNQGAQQQQTDASPQQNNSHLSNSSSSNNNNKYSALDQLGSLREFVWAASGHDISNMVPVLDGLTMNEDQLGNITNKQHLS